MRAEDGAAGAQVDVPRRKPGAFRRKPQAFLAGGKPCLGATQPQQRADDGYQFLRCKRLDEIDLSAAFHADLLVCFSDVRRRDMQHGDAACYRVALDATADVESADIRQLHVEQHQLGCFRCDELQRRRAVARLEDGESGAPKNPRLRIQRRLVVVDVEDRGAFRKGGHGVSLENDETLDAAAATFATIVPRMSRFDATRNACDSSDARSVSVRSCAVATMTGIRPVAGDAFRRPSSSKPFTSGNPRSSTIARGFAISATRNPSSPVAASSTSSCDWSSSLRIA